jgi:GntR family transcriptional repressor for pyruvate dehydrogenase complex
MTLRQALAILREAGYIDTRRGRGAGSFVVDDLSQPLATGAAPPSRQALRDLIDWRRAVSAEAAWLTAQRADESARAAITAAATRADVAALRPFADYRLADSGFHIGVAEASGSTRIVAAETAIQAELGEILLSLPGSWSTEAVRASTAGHAPILSAILSGDADAARAAMADHVESTYDWILGLRLGRLGDDVDD